MAKSHPIEHLLARNRAWAERVKAADPGAFRRLARGQSPDILWIGCSDSRVPATQVIDQPPGRVFVHRNIANLAVPSDLNCQSVLQYAVEVLRVRHVIVCGHYGCGGVQAALSGKAGGAVGEWLKPVRAVRRRRRDELDALEPDARERRLVELNVIEQVRSVAAMRVVQAAWQARAGPTLHGWVYEVADGLVRVLCEHAPE